MITERGIGMKNKKVMAMIILIVLIVIGTLFCVYSKNQNSFVDNWNIKLPDQIVSIYHQYPESSFHNDGVYYEVYDMSHQQLDLSLQSQKNQEVEQNFNQCVEEVNIPEKYLPDFSKDYEYYMKNENGGYIIFIVQNSQLFITALDL